MAFQSVMGVGHGAVASARQLRLRGQHSLQLARTGSTTSDLAIQWSPRTMHELTQRHQGMMNLLRLKYLISLWECFDSLGYFGTSDGQCSWRLGYSGIWCSLPPNRKRLKRALMGLPERWWPVTTDEFGWKSDCQGVYGEQCQDMSANAPQHSTIWQPPSMLFALLPFVWYYNGPRALSSSEEPRFILSIATLCLRPETWMH